ncbi:glycosyltransferase family 8 protein [Cereibacter azotoformans]|uniref:glycosyltransferase family 8 protein n=1 Tax=Cereibacter azotoformans TaxID=43057 RepID=UPI003B223B8A
MALNVEASRPARARQAVIFCCDRNYYPYAMFAAAQIAGRHPDRGFDICIASLEAIEEPHSLSELAVRHCTIDAAHLFADFGLDDRRTAVTYLRLVLPEAFSEDYDRILYLDSDIYIQGGDLAALLALPLAARPLAAVRDNKQWRTPSRRMVDFDRLGLPQRPYFNSGVLLFDVPAFRAANLLQEALRIGRSQGRQLVRHDQSLLNAAVLGNWAELSPSWNWQYTWSSRLFAAMLGPNIIHFIGRCKPWCDPDNLLSPQFARDLQIFLARHFPDHPPLPLGPGMLPDSLAMRRMLMKHLLSSGRLARYLERFPSDLTVGP